MHRMELSFEYNYMVIKSYVITFMHQHVVSIDTLLI